MATGKSYFGRMNYRFLSGDHAKVTSDTTVFEFGESVRSGSPEYQKPISAKRSTDLGGDHRKVTVAAASLPVKVPDWSKILRDEYRDNRRRESFDDDDDGDFGDERARVPPHEFLARQMARTRIASFSVHEGILI